VLRGKKLRHQVKKLRSKFRVLQRKGKAADRRRFDARGMEMYFALEVLYGRVYRSARDLDAVLKATGACRRGEVHLIDDVTDPLHPAQKSAWDPEIGFQPPADRPSESASDAFAYDPVSYAVKEEVVHGETLTVAVHRSVESLGYPFSLEDLQDVVLRILHEAIHVHNGFSVDRFVFKVRPPEDGESFALCLGGASVSTRFLNQLGLGQAHEPFHSWNGGIYDGEPDGSENLFQLTTLVTEGWTVYYTYLLHSRVIAPYAFESAMRYFYNVYLTYRGNSEYDLPYAELAAKASEFGTGSSIFGDMMSARAMLTAYYLDAELVKQGKTLEEVMRALYRRGLDDERFTLRR